MTLALCVVAALGAGFLAGWWSFSRREDSEREKLFSFIAHELNSQVTGLQLTAGNLLAGSFGALAQEQRRWIEAIDSRTDLLGDLIGDLRDAAHWEFGGQIALRPEAVDVKELLEREHARLRPGAERREISLTLQVPDGVSKAKADAYRLKRAVSSVLQNAMGFSGKGGAIAVSAADERGRVRLEVGFTAPADLPEAAGDIFALRYPALRPEQALRVIGVGLGVAKRAMEESGGSLVLENAAGGERRFVLTIPAFRV